MPLSSVLWLCASVESVQSWNCLALALVSPLVSWLCPLFLVSCDFVSVSCDCVSLSCDSVSVCVIVMWLCRCVSVSWTVGTMRLCAYQLSMSWLCFSVVSVMWLSRWHVLDQHAQLLRLSAWIRCVPLWRQFSDPPFPAHLRSCDGSLPSPLLKSYAGCPLIEYPFFLTHLLLHCPSKIHLPSSVLLGYTSFLVFFSDADPFSGVLLWHTSLLVLFSDTDPFSSVLLWHTSLL